MKQLVQKNLLTTAGFALVLGLTTSTANAQTVTGAATPNTIAKQTLVNYGTTETGSIKVVDNKGTVKYLQSNNGITTFTNKTGDVTTTTWQLGGTLTEDTYIDATGKVFALDGIELLTTPIATSNSNTDLNKSKHGGTTTGFTLLVRDEATGAIQKLKSSDLIISGVVKYAIATSTDFTAYDPAVSQKLVKSSVLPVGVPYPDVSKVTVFRNGIKLVADATVTTGLALSAGSDYAVNKSDSQIEIYSHPGVTDDSWQFFDNDVIEIHWFK